MHRYHQLTERELEIIEKCATELPGSGLFNTHSGEGVYLCKRCDLPLYLSEYKFNCGCAWPSFENQIEGNVIELPDPDGMRTEIRCKRCSAHLGHLFLNEGLTSTNRRHCVNSISLELEPHYTKENNCRSLLAGGCFWGVEHLLKDLTGVIAVSSGYMGGCVVDPSYEEVCSGTTGHVEAVEIIYSRDLLYSDLLKFFLEIHNPTQRNGQGPDIGSQYRSAIFYFNRQEQTNAQKLLKALNQKGLKCVTEVTPASRFYKAEQYHQNYYAKSGKIPYCHKRVPRFD